MVSALQGPAAHWGVRNEQTIARLGGLCSNGGVLWAGRSPARLGKGLSGGSLETQKPEVSHKRLNGRGAGKEVEMVFQAGWHPGQGLEVCECSYTHPFSMCPSCGVAQVTPTVLSVLGAELDRKTGMLLSHPVCALGLQSVCLYP